MKKILLILLFIVCAYGQNTDKGTYRSANEVLYRSFENTLEALRVKLVADSRYTTPDSLYGGADTLTNGWVDMGAEIDMRGYTHLNIWATLDVGACEDVKIRAMSLYESGGSKYPFSIETVSSSKVSLEPELTEFTNNDDQNILIKIAADGSPFLHLQMSAGTAKGSGKFSKIFINKVVK